MFLVYELEGGSGGVLGVVGGWLPLLTRPQRYCDPLSLVLLSTHSRNDFMRVKAGLFSDLSFGPSVCSSVTFSFD